MVIDYIAQSYHDTPIPVTFRKTTRLRFRVTQVQTSTDDTHIYIHMYLYQDCLCHTYPESRIELTFASKNLYRDLTLPR